MPTLTIEIDDEVAKILKKRADKNFLTSREQAEDIIRRSIVSYKKNTGNSEDTKIDDSLVNIFSRSKKGRKKKKK